nr:MAG TPA: hypothetical protein [Caudoviricetes sp.]
MTPRFSQLNNYSVLHLTAGRCFYIQKTFACIVNRGTVDLN